MNILGLITARGGSKSIPGKNIAPVAGKPLLAWTVEAALASKRINRTIITTDDEAIAEAARKAGAEVPFMRPAELAQDETPHLPVVVHAVRRLIDDGWTPDLVVILQPTSPLRRSKDIDNAVEQLLESDAPSIASVMVSAHPHLLRTMDENRTLIPMTKLPEVHPRRQDMDEIWKLNGAVYVIRTEALLAGKCLVGEGTVGYEMPWLRSLDIDTPADLEDADRLLKAQNAGR